MNESAADASFEAARVVANVAEEEEAVVLDKVDGGDLSSYFEAEGDLRNAPAGVTTEVIVAFEEQLKRKHDLPRMVDGRLSVLDWKTAKDNFIISRTRDVVRATLCSRATMN